MSAGNDDPLPVILPELAFPSLSAGPKVACSVELLMLHTRIQEISINADAVRTSCVGGGLRKGPKQLTFAGSHVTAGSGKTMETTSS